MREQSRTVVGEEGFLPLSDAIAKHVSDGACLALGGFAPDPLRPAMTDPAEPWNLHLVRGAGPHL
jgi:hypothetical protein